VATMMELLSEVRGEKGPTAVCLIVLLGCSNPPLVTGDNLDSSSLAPFPAVDVFRLVCVPGNDAFGVSEAIQNLGTSTERSEIYSSHAFLTCENSAKDLLRKSSKNSVDELFNALHLSPKKTTGNLPKKPKTSV
jgi:hypothetical protein